jgi:hypothetical protein
MDYKFVSKNNIGAVATLVLIIILSQSRFFDFLIDTALGRAVLIMFILGISCVNKILGVVAVLFIIIMFNHSSLGYLEGFTQEKDTDKDTDKDKNTDKDKDKTKDNTTLDGREGFNTVDRESAILKGKKSSELPLGSNARKQNDDVEPADKTTFTNLNSSVL